MNARTNEIKYTRRLMGPEMDFHRVSTIVYLLGKIAFEVQKGYVTSPV